MLTSIPLEVFQLQHLEKLDLSGNRIGNIPPEIENLKNLRRLDLSGNRLKDIPAAICQIPKLHTLRLNNNQLKELPVELGQISELTTLDLDYNPITYFPQSISRLQNLIKLSLSTARANPADVPGWLPQLKKIRNFALTGFGLSYVPDWIVQWTDLESLNLRGNRLSKIPDWIGELKNLTALFFPDNQLTELPASLSRLRNLRSLNLAKNKIQDFPTFVLELENIFQLDLSYNKISTIPPTISNLQRLFDLNLSGNSLSALPDSVRNLKNLKFLGLSSNHLVAVPEAIYELTDLEWLDLDSLNENDNQIKEISDRILHLKKLEFFYVSGNPLEIPPPEIAEKGIASIREYFHQLADEGVDHLYEAKLLIVGEGGAGKTTLTNKIIDPHYLLREEDSTRGIDVVRWYFPLNNGKIFQVNIWDFGGQEIYHATHQFFLTKRSLYALVTDTRKEDTDFYYWLNVIELLSDGSPILIIKNEKQDRHREIDERALRGRFTNLKETLATNLANGRGLDKVLQEIRHQIARLPHIGAPLPATWVRVREALEQDPRNYVSLEEYLAICEKHGFVGLKARLQLSEYLHDLGVCLHFQDDPVLKKTVILRPKWGTDAVYKVLDNARVIRNLGRFSRRDLKHIWAESEYAAVQDELLQLMMKFKLCYPLPKVANTYIAPQLLSANQPDYPWEEANNLLLRYTYEFMPKGILTQFIVAMNGLIEEQRLVWKSGTVLSKDQTLAEIKEHYDRREIRIRVSGKHRKDLLIIATHELDKIHASYQRLEYNKLVPCNCSTCRIIAEPHFYVFSVLRRFIEDRQFLIQCQRSYEMVDVLRLVDDVLDQEQLMAIEARTQSGSPEEQRSQFLFHGTVEQVIIQHTPGGESTLYLKERRDGQMSKPSRESIKARSAWANGSFYLFTFVIVIAAVGLLARTVPAYVLPVLLIGGAIFIPLIGALQLRMDERLSQKSFIELLKLVVGQLPLLRRLSKQQQAAGTDEPS
jgi:internalin A